MHFLPPDLEAYLNTQLPEEANLLSALSRETHMKVVQPRMISGHYQGRLLSLISKMITPKYILEIGTYTGYSALCLAEGLVSDGVLHTIDINPELQHIQQKYFRESNYAEQIVSHIGDAVSIIPALEETFDLIFIDAHKVEYEAYLEVVLPNCKSGSVILCDNVLWSGKIIENVPEDDKATRALQKFNDRIRNDARLESIILPVRDGLTLCRVR